MYRIIVCALLLGASSAAGADTRVHTVPQTQSIFFSDDAALTPGKVAIDGDFAIVISNALGGFEFVMMVAAEAGRPANGCDPAPAGFALPNFGVPGIGASTAVLKAAFGAASGSGKITYRSDRPGGYANIAQYIGYVLKGGKVAGIGVGETSVPTEH